MKISGYTLIIIGTISIGTIGLLVNEFITEWGSIATLLFASFNIIGLSMLVATHRSTKD
jgi:undecaprenyl pyrophosphate phosphatase UppP